MKVSYIKLLDQEHPLCFSLSAVEAVEREFGSMDGMLTALKTGSIGEIAAATDRVLQILLTAGRIYANAAGQDVPPQLPCRPADLIDVRDRDTVEQIFAAISGDTDREVELETKNGEATPGQ